TFNLYQNEEEVDSKVTDSEGIVVFEGLVPGEYFLEEIAPDGYESSIDGLLAVNVVGKEVSSVNVINSLITGGIEVIKTIDSIDGNPQEGVTFNLYQNEEEVDSKVTDSEGIVVFEGLVPGEYFLEEIVPDGYESSIDGLLAINVVGKEVNVVSVINTEIIEIDDEEIPLGPIIFPVDPKDDPKEIDDDKEVVIIDEEKTPLGGAKLPKTGSIPTVLFYGAGLALVLTGTILKKKK
ncbi:LPXTG cell wall anchor domain-containing protein, partial [Alkalibaculum sp. M08DMB]